MVRLGWLPCRRPGASSEPQWAAMAARSEQSYDELLRTWRQRARARVTRGGCARAFVPVCGGLPACDRSGVCWRGAGVRSGPVPPPHPAAGRRGADGGRSNLNHARPGMLPGRSWPNDWRDMTSSSPEPLGCGPWTISRVRRDSPAGAGRECTGAIWSLTLSGI